MYDRVCQNMVYMPSCRLPYGFKKDLNSSRVAMVFAWIGSGFLYSQPRLAVIFSEFSASTGW